MDKHAKASEPDRSRTQKTAITVRICKDVVLLIAALVKLVQILFQGHV